MAVRESNFSPEAALESILYIASKVGHEPTFHELLKIRYEADKLHLARYGFLASGDTYSAMRFGPVASNIYNMLKAAKGQASVWIHPRLVEVVTGNLAVRADGKTVVALRGPDLAHLSSADIKCLNEAIASHSGLDFARRTARSHDPAYRDAYAAALNRGDDAGPMSIEAIASMLPNGIELIEHSLS